MHDFYFMNLSIVVVLVDIKDNCRKKHEKKFRRAGAGNYGRQLGTVQRRVSILRLISTDLLETQVNLQLRHVGPVWALRKPGGEVGICAGFAGFELLRV